MQALTGVWQLLYYVPTTDHAYDSVTYLRLHVEFGWLVHGLHFWGANFFLVVVGLHMARTFIWGAYKKPRELTWILGVLLLFTTILLVFTGALLPWDELGYWAAQVGTNMAGTVPWLGGFLKPLLRAGYSMSQLTLSRFFTFHVMILPAALALLIAVHLVAFRRHGSAGPWRPEKHFRTGPFWPDQVLMDMVVASVLLAAMVFLSAYWPAQVSGPADPLDNHYQPKPEWPFLFLYQTLKVFHGPMEAVGTALLPLLIILGLLLVPFLDRGRERAPAKRPVFMVVGFVFAAGVLILTYFGYVSKPGEVKAPAPAAAAKSAAAPGAVPAPKEADVANGARLFLANGCNACHTVDGQGGNVGPDLSGEGLKAHSADWLVTQITDPKAHVPTSVMPPYPSLSAADLGDLAAYLSSLRTAPAAVPQAQPAPAQAQPRSKSEAAPTLAATWVGTANLGGVLYDAYCAGCHGASGRGGVPNPGSTSGAVPALAPARATLASDDADEFARNLDLFIQHGSTPTGPSPAMTMPAFGDSNALTQQEISALEAYILRLNGVDRAQITRPGVPPRAFAWGTLGVFALAWAAIAVGRRRRGAAPDESETSGGA